RQLDGIAGGSRGASQPFQCDHLLRVALPKFSRPMASGYGGAGFLSLQPHISSPNPSINPSPLSLSLLLKKHHHFVPRFYLRSWAEKDKIYCLQDGAVHRPNIKNVCATNYFYSLQRLSVDDITFLREAIIKGSPNALKESHEQMLRILMLPYVAK